MAADREREFGEYLRGEREQAEIDLHSIARQTRIPMRSLRNLEDGAFDKLPADIFVRGFLRSYADCVGIDRAEVLERYRELGIKPPAFSSDIVAAVRRSRERRSDATPLPQTAADAGAQTASPDATPGRKRPRTLLPRLVDNDREGGRRGPVTVAVIILVIVATLTMSYLLRKPSSGSDGFTGVDDIGGDLSV